MSNLKKLEKEVKKNSNMLEPMIKKYMETKKDQFIIFNKGEMEFAPSYNEGVDIGIKKFGADTGFVVKKITMNTPVFSSFVKL